MTRVIGVLLCLILWGATSTAQKSIQQDEQLWMGIFNQNRISKRWGTWTDIHFRLKNGFIIDPSQFLLRIGPTFYLSDDVRFTAAYSFINHFPEANHPEISRPEHRPFQQLQWFTRFPKARLMQWIRLEERFVRKLTSTGDLAAGYGFNWRIRYNYGLSVPLSKKGSAPGHFQLFFNDEIMFNFGKKVLYNSFDQNRLFAGLVYQVTAHSNVQLGYMNLFQQLPAGNNYRAINSIRGFYFHNFDLRKK